MPFRTGAKALSYRESRVNVGWSWTHAVDVRIRRAPSGSRVPYVRVDDGDPGHRSLHELGSGYRGARTMSRSSPVYGLSSARLAGLRSASSRKVTNQANPASLL